MKLKKLKLAGFKSFVDPTTVNFPSELVAIVGPNGCGKSNTIDAVRWVMGESSAKYLRGESMADVIFNGSSARKAVGQASVELVFDNSDGKLGGEYAGFAEISVKRQVNRDGMSVYYLNGARCRRRDITHLFLGTGLGPRSYAIIEQGMISRLIEAKPEDLRVYLEEVAGISKYKDRRKETEQRIRHTQDNLDRVNDLREELDQQLVKLQRQAHNANHFKSLDQELQRKKSELQALSWRQHHSALSKKDEAIADMTLDLESLLSDKSGLQSAIETLRVQQAEDQDAVQVSQDLHYTLNSEVTQLEKTLAHHQNNSRRLTENTQQCRQQFEAITEQLTTDHAQFMALRERQATLKPEYDALSVTLADTEQALTEAETVMAQWQQRWDSFNQQAALTRQQVEVNQTQIRHSEQTLHSHEQTLERLSNELNELELTQLTDSIHQYEDELHKNERIVASHETEITQLGEQLSAQREDNKRIAATLKQDQQQIHALEREHASLDALQQAALSKHSEEVKLWLEEHELQHLPRLAQAIQVEQGWDNAVETVLGHYLEAICVNDLEQLIQTLPQVEEGRLALLGPEQTQHSTAHTRLDLTPLMSKIQTSYPLAGLIQAVYCVDNIDQALQIRTELQAHESVITPEGVWMGVHWLKMSRAMDETAGVLQREQALTTVISELERLKDNLKIVQAQHDAGEDTLHHLELERDRVRQQLNQAGHRVSDVRTKLSGLQSKVLHVRERIEVIEHDMAELKEQCSEIQVSIKAARTTLEADIETMAEHNVLKQNLMDERQRAGTTLKTAQQKVNQEKDELSGLRVRLSQVDTECAAIEKNNARQREQKDQLAERITTFEAEYANLAEPIAETELALEQTLVKRLQAESHLDQARAQLNHRLHDLQQEEDRRAQLNTRETVLRDQVAQCRIDREAQAVRCQTIEEALAEREQTVSEVLEALTDDADETVWQQAIHGLEKSIQRLGSINLAAIEEYDVQAQRKAHIDEQYDDLTEALGTLEDAIAKIDKQTRERFKETYSAVNTNLQALFPRMFGGGEAYLEMTSQDILDTGIIIRARPPGKQNTTIHLLSGGEKALVAIALVFSLFRLNPAPFCMLDEVDAPLDDANVGRFCRLVKEMSSEVQFIFITHNKVTMELAKHLMGVTMREAGISRLVSVDVAKAVEMVEA